MPGTPSPTRESLPEQRQTAPEADFAFASHGLRIGVAFVDLPVMDNLASAMPPGSIPIEPTGLDRLYSVFHLDAASAPFGHAGYYVLADDDPSRSPVGATEDRVIATLEDRFERYVAEYSVEHLFVHAGVVAWEGRAIVIPGRSHAGKSTLTKGLVDAGATYYSDEFAVLDRDGNVHPYRRRLSLRDGPYGPAGRIDMTGGSLDPLPPVPVGVVALLRFSEDDGWQIETLTGASAIMAMCDHTVAIRRRPADTFAILGAVERQATVITGTRGEADETIDRLRALLNA